MTLLLAIAAALLLIQAPAPASQSLFANSPVRASLAGGERAFYTLDVPAHYAARVTIHQEGLDVNVRMVRHGDAMVGAQFYNYTGGDSGEERLYPLVLDRAMTWDIRLSPVLPRATRGDVVIEVDMAPADDHDRAVASARWTFYEAIVVLDNPDGAGLRTARDKYAAAAAAARENGDVRLEAEGMFQLGRMLDQLGDSPASLEAHLRALSLFRQLGQKDRQSRTLNRLGDVSRKLGAVTDAEAYFREALPLAREVNDLNNIADTLNNSGLLLLATGRAEESIAQLEAALPLAREINSANVELALLNNIAEGYKQLGMFEKAVEMSASSLPVADRLGVPRRTARTLMMLAENYFVAGDPARADATIKRSLAVYETAGDSVGFADALGSQAQMWAASGDTDRALAAFAVARPLLEKAQNRPAQATLLTSWAGVEIDRGEYDAALLKLDTAIALTRATNARDTEARAEYLRATAYQRQQRIDEAVAAIRRVIENVENTRGSIARVDLRTSYLAAVRSYYDLYIDLLQQRGDSAAAFAISERARARTLLEGLAESSVKIAKGVDPQLLLRERAVQRDLNAKENYRAALVLRDGEASPAALAASLDIARLVEQWDQVRGQIRKASPAYAALQMPEPITADTLQQQLLDASTALVEYHLGAAHSYAWVIDRGSITVHNLPAAAEIEKLARQYHESVSRDVDAISAAERDTLTQSSRSLGRQLASAVWKPIEARVKGRRVVIVADQALQYVPFSALPASNGTPVLAAHEIVELPSASVLATLRKTSRTVSLGASTAVFADPVFSKNDVRLAASREAAAAPATRAEDSGLYGRLRFSRREAEAIAQRAPAAFAALDFAATKSAVTSRSLKSFRVLHFATHGTLNTEHPELSGLVFSLVDKAGKPVDGFLRLHEIYNLDLDADLVVLSACRTALGREVHGEGLIGLTRGFMYAGASRVVSSVWNVDDRASALLMSRFYDAMTTKKLTPAAALRDAQLSMLNDPRWSNPHYWAAFGIQGEWK